MRKQRFELVEKENSIRARIDQIDVDARPESIEKSVAVMGTLRPEELRDARRKSLDSEKRNLTNLLNEIVTAKNRLDQNVVSAEALVEKTERVEKDIDDGSTKSRRNDQKKSCKPLNLAVPLNVKGEPVRVSF